MKKKLAVLLLICACLFRFTLIILPSYRIDMNTWKAWSNRLIQTGPVNFYDPNYFSDYFPGYLYMLWFLGTSFSFIFSLSSVSSVNFEYYLKFFTNIFDLGTAFYIYKIVARYKKSIALFSPIPYLLNPALLFNSSVMGQVDGILTFFLVFSAYNLIELKKPYRWSISGALALLIKPQGLAIFPIFLIDLLKGKFKLTKFYSLILIPILIIFFSVPFFIKDPILGIFHLFQKSANVYPYTGMFTYNLWSLVGWWKNDNMIWLFLSYQQIGIILYFLSLILILVPILRFTYVKDKFSLYFAMALSSMSFFILLTRMHERYLFPFFAFFLIASFIKKSYAYAFIYISFSLIHFANLWHVYYYYNYVYVDPKYSTFFIYDLLSKNSSFFSVVSLFLFGVLFLLYYKNFKKIKND